MRIVAIVGAVVLVLVVAAAIWFSLRAGTTVQAAAVERGAIREFVDERGKTRLPKEYLVTMPYPGRIEPIELVEGQAVQVDQVVAQIVPSDLENELAEAKAAVERLDASIAENEDISVEERTRQQAELFHDSMIATVKAAEARLKAGLEKLNYSESFLGRISKLVPTGARTEDDEQKAELQYVEAGVDYQQDVLVAEATKSIEAATALLPKLVTDYIDRKSLARQVLKKEKSEAEARLRQAETRKERGTLTSPVDGVVLDRQESNERFLAGGEVLLKIGRMEELEVETDVLSQDVVRVSVGDPVMIYGPATGRDAANGLPGKVKRVNPAGFTKISSLGVEQQRVKVIVELDPETLAQWRREQDVGVDYQVQVRIFTADKPAALTVPRSAVFRGADGGWQVFAIRGGVAKLTPVEVGLSNDQQVEITKGLAAGDQVVLAPESNLVDDTRVSPILRETK